MNIGRINLDEGQEPGGGLTGYLSDVPRLILLILMLLGAIIGGYYNSVSDRPEKVIKRSLNKSLGKSFKASLEGSTTLKNSVLSLHRTRQQYTPGKGITSSSRPADNDSDSSSHGVIPDAFSGLAALHHTTFITEHNKEDMYGHATRHYSGSFKRPADGDGDAFVYAYEYWIDMTSLLAVRLMLTTVERNADVDDKGEPVSKVTYINIRFHDWR